MDLDEAKLEEYREAARFLRETYRVSRVAVFGSAARGRFIDERSDLDLAVWGLDERLCFRAQGQILALDPDLTIDLVRYEDARPALCCEIDREWIDV